MTTTDAKLESLAEARDLMSTRDVAAYLNVSLSAIDNLRYKGRLAFIRVGKLVRFERSDVDNYIDSCKRVAPQQTGEV